MVAFLLVVVGALNWGLVGFFNFNLVSTLLGTGMLTNVVYDLVGLSAVYILVNHRGTCSVCGGKA